MVVFLTVTKKDRIEQDPDRDARAAASTARRPRARRREQDGRDPGAVDAVRERAAAGPGEFVLLVPNPDHLPSTASARTSREGEQVLAEALPALEERRRRRRRGPRRASPNAYDDIVDELDASDYDEIILETLPHHVSHWLHVDLPQRVAELGYPLTTVAATA